MPATIESQTLKVKLTSLPRNTEKQKAAYTAWKMLEVFLNARLTQENRTRPEETDDDGQEASTL